MFAAFPGKNHSHGDSEQVTEGLTKDFQDDAPRYYLCTSFQAGEGSLPSLKSAQHKENKLFVLSFIIPTCYWGKALDSQLGTARGRAAGYVVRIKKWVPGK